MIILMVEVFLSVSNHKPAKGFVEICAGELSAYEVVIHFGY
jgi:hypothetical protein